MNNFYAIIGEDVPDSNTLRQAHRGAHLDRLAALQAEGRLIMAGPFPAIDNVEPGAAGYSGSLIVAEFDTLRAAQDWADHDPYLLGGVYSHIMVKPFKKVMP